ncbi:MAG: hypothetical protein Q9P01_05735 [Anaerolineae bacterium]|nr:hypothetical protein [Anaerolineae bacterium]
MKQSRSSKRASAKIASTAKHQIATLTELGIIDLMPKNFGHGDAGAILKLPTTAAARLSVTLAATIGQPGNKSDLSSL